MVLFVIRKLILQTRMRSHPVWLDVWYLVWPFFYFHTSCVRTTKALARLRGCAGSPEPSLVAYVISTIISSWLKYSYSHHKIKNSSNNIQILQCIYICQDANDLLISHSNKKKIHIHWGIFILFLTNMSTGAGTNQQKHWRYPPPPYSTHKKYHSWTACIMITTF